MPDRLRLARADLARGTGPHAGAPRLLRGLDRRLGPAVLAAGARRHEQQPSPDGRFVVYLDPVGHPFCLCEE
uniref:VOC family protein n=1 Tax=Dietzia cercidiphylli TaxID=498199 RepID=UPI00351DA000